MARVGNLTKKGMDTDLDLNPIIATTSTNASSFVVNLVQQGSGSWNRVGRKILNKTLRIKGHILVQSTPTFATGSSNSLLVRIVAVWDQQPSGAAIPTFDAIFGITDQTGAEATNSILDPPRYDNMDRFKVLLDRAYTPADTFVPAFGTGPVGQENIPVDEFIKLGGKETVFSGQSSPMTIADISTGAIYVYLRATQNGSTVISTFTGVARLRYMN